MVTPTIKHPKTSVGRQESTVSSPWRRTRPWTQVALPGRYVIRETVVPRLINNPNLDWHLQYGAQCHTVEEFLAKSTNPVMPSPGTFLISTWWKRLKNRKILKTGYVGVAFDPIRSEIMD